MTVLRPERTNDDLHSNGSIRLRGTRNAGFRKQIVITHPVAKLKMASRQKKWKKVDHFQFKVVWDKQVFWFFRIFQGENNFQHGTGKGHCPLSELKKKLIQ